MIINVRFLTQKLTGVQRYALELSLVIKKMRPDTHFLAPKNIIHKDIAAELGAKIIGRHTGYIWEQWELPRYITENQPGAVLFNPANVAPVSYRNKVVTIHDTAPLRHPEWYSWKFATAYKYLLPKVAESSKLIFADSNFSKSEIVSFLAVDESKIRVIYCAADQKFRNIAVKKNDAPESDYILCVASLDPRKNFARLSGAFDYLENTGLRLVVVGRKSNIFADPDLESMLLQDDRFEFTGQIDDNRLIELYRNARLFVYPSLYEGFGLPPLEAMACGCPCVVSRSGSLPEVCADAAVYCDPHNPRDIADKILMVLDDEKLRADLIRKGHDRAEYFDWQKSAGQLLEAVEALEESAD